MTSLLLQRSTYINVVFLTCLIMETFLLTVVPHGVLSTIETTRTSGVQRVLTDRVCLPQFRRFLFR